MKRMIAFLFGLTILFSISFFKTDNFSIVNDFEKLVVVSKEPLLYQNYQISGNQYYYTLSNIEGKKFLEDKNDHDIEGYIFYFNNSFDFDNFSKDVEFLIEKNTQITNYDIYYGYYSKFDDYRYVNNKKINFQLVHNDEKWILGFPIILTGF